MSSEKLYTQKKLETKKENITAVGIFERNLLTGDDQGKLTLYNIKTDNLAIIKETKFHSKIDKIFLHLPFHYYINLLNNLRYNQPVLKQDH